MVGVTTATIQSIELGRLKLSRTLAERIALETGVDANWLIANNTKRPPKDQFGKRYTRRTYEEYRANAEHESLWLLERHPEEMRDDAAHAALRKLDGAWRNMPLLLISLFGQSVDAAKHGNLRLFHFKVRESLAALQKELGLEIPETIKEFEPRFPHCPGRNPLERFWIQPLADAFWAEMIDAHQAADYVKDLPF